MIFTSHVARISFSSKIIKIRTYVETLRNSFRNWIYHGLEDSSFLSFHRFVEFWITETLEVFGIFSFNSSFNKINIAQYCKGKNFEMIFKQDGGSRIAKRIFLKFSHTRVYNFYNIWGKVLSLSHRKPSNKKREKEQTYEWQNRTFTVQSGDQAWSSCVTFFRRATSLQIVDNFSLVVGSLGRRLRSSAVPCFKRGKTRSEGETTERETLARKLGFICDKRVSSSSSSSHSSMFPRIFIRRTRNYVAIREGQRGWGSWSRFTCKWLNGGPEPAQDPN